MASPTANTAHKKNPTRNLWIGVGAALTLVVAIAAVIAFAGGGSTNTVTSLPTEVEEFRPVVVTGAPLPTMAEGVDPAIGTQAPQLDGSTFDGSAITIKPGEPTLVVLLAHWCPHCQREVPRLVQWNQEGGVPQGVQIVGIATATDSQKPNFPPSAWLARETFPWPVLVDSAKQEAANALGLSAFPTFVFLDAEGKVLFRTSGEVAMSALRTKIIDALGT
ncbi:MAG: TlpA disulfide reductase family protein [Actinomycetota bacterium]